VTIIEELRSLNHKIDASHREVAEYTASSYFSKLLHHSILCDDVEPWLCGKNSASSMSRISEPVQSWQRTEAAHLLEKLWQWTLQLWENQIKSIHYLVGGFYHLEKYMSMGRIIPYIMENKQCLKPPTRLSGFLI
jgi:hypothetical protein